MKVYMKNIKEENNEDLLKWFEFEIKKNHYDPLCTSAKTPYTLDQLRDEMVRRLRKASGAKFNA